MWNGGYPSKLGSYLHEQGSPCCPILPFILWPRCQQAWSLPQQVHPDRIHNSHQTLGPFPTSLVIPLHKWTRTFNDLHIQLGNLGISHTERDRMHGHEPDGTWLKKLGPGGRLQSETTKAERNHRDLGCDFGPFPAPSSPSGWNGAKDEFRSLGEFAEAERRMAVTYCHVTCPNSCRGPKTDQTKHSYGISVTSRQSPKRAYSWGSV